MSESERDNWELEPADRNSIKTLLTSRGRELLQRYLTEQIQYTEDQLTSKTHDSEYIVNTGYSEYNVMATELSTLRYLLELPDIILNREENIRYFNEQKSKEDKDILGLL